MTSATIWDLSTTPGSVSEINGAVVSENCSPAGINDSIRGLAAFTAGAMLAVTASGTDTYAASLAPAPASLVDGMTVRIRFTNANTSTTPTLNINSLGAKTIVRDGGVALAAGDIPAGHEGDLTYRASDTKWVLRNPKSYPGTVTSVSVTAGAGLTQSGSPVTSSGSITVGADPAYHRGYLSGLGLTRASATTVTFAAGVAVDSTAAAFIMLGSASTKTLQASGVWTAGTGNNGLFSSAKANSTWYHCFVIAKADGTVDCGFDTSVSAANIPSGYTYFRRVGSIKTDGSGNILDFIQDDDLFIWKSAIQELNGTAATTETTLTLAGVPTGVKTRGQFTISLVAGSAVEVNWLALYPTGLSSNSNQQVIGASQTASSAVTNYATTEVLADTSAQVKYIASAARTATINTRSYRDRRGRGD